MVNQWMNVDSEIQLRCRILAKSPEASCTQVAGLAGPDISSYTQTSHLRYNLLFCKTHETTRNRNSEWIRVPRWFLKFVMIACEITWSRGSGLADSQSIVCPTNAFAQLHNFLNVVKSGASPTNANGLGVFPQKSSMQKVTLLSPRTCSSMLE